MLDQEHEGGMKVCSSVLGGVIGKGMPNEDEGENSSGESEDEDKDDDEDADSGQEENEEAEFHKTYCKKHKGLAVIVYIVFFAVNLHIAFTQSDNAAISLYLVGILVTNQILILGMLFSLLRTLVGCINKLSGLLNIALAVQLLLLDQNNSYSFSHQDEILGLMVFGAHTILMLSSQFVYDFIGFIVSFIVHSVRLGCADNIFPLVVMWCIITVSTLQQYMHKNAIRELFFSKQRQKQLLDAIETVLPSAVFSLNKTNIKCFQQQPKLPHGNTKNATAPTNKQNQQGSIDASQRNSCFKVQVQQEQQLQQNKQHLNQQQSQQQQQLPVSPNNQLKNYPSSLNPVSQNISAAATSPNNRNITSNALLVQKQPGQIVRSMAGFTEILQGSTSCAGNISYQPLGHDPLLQWTLSLSNNHSKQAYKITDMCSFVHFANHVYVDARQFVEDTPKESMEDNLQPKPAAPSKYTSTLPFNHQPKRQSPPSSHLGDSHFHGILAPPINLSRSNYLQNSQAIVNFNTNNPTNNITTSNYNTNNNSILQANIPSLNQNRIPQNILQPVPFPEMKIQNSIGFHTHNTNHNSNNIASTGIQNSVPAKSTMHLRGKESEVTRRPKKGLCAQLCRCLRRNKRIRVKKIKSERTEQEITQQLNAFGNPLETGGHNQTTLLSHLKSILEKQNSNSETIKKKKKVFVWKFNGKYYPDEEEGLRDALGGERGEQENTSKRNNTNGIAIQVKVCGFQGQNRLFFCVDDVSVSEKIQLYQAQDKFKDLVLANTAHDLRQPLNSLNYTITEAKKILLNLKAQNQVQKSNDQSVFADSVVGFVSESGIIEPKKNNLQEKQEFPPDIDAPTFMECKQAQDPNISRRSVSSTEIAQNGDNQFGSSSRSNGGSKNTNKLEEKSLKVQEINMIIELLELAEVSGNSLKYLINDILDHAKLREGKLQANFKECSLSSIFEFTKHIFNHQFKERGIIFKIFLDPKIEPTWKICTDQQRLQQVLVNLLSNAMKFTQANKYVILHISRVSKNVNNRIISLLKITVIDQGCGMSESQLNQIFAPFVSFNDNSLNIEGIGLGLHICKSIVSLLGPYPRLFVRSKLNEGSKFFFYIYHQLRKGSQAFKTPKPPQTPQDEIAYLQQSRKQLKSQPVGIHELQEVLDKKSIVSIIEDSQTSNDANNAVFSETKMDSNDRKLQKSDDKNKNKTPLAAEQYTGSNEQDIMSIEEEMKSPEKRPDETLEEEEEDEDEEGKGTELDIQSIIMEVVGSEDFQEQSTRNQSHCHQMNKYWHFGQLPHTITSLNSHKSNQSQNKLKSEQQQLCLSPYRSRDNHSQKLIDLNSNQQTNPNIIGFQHALAKESQFQSHFVQSPRANQSTFFNQSTQSQQAKNFIHQSTKQLLPLLPLVATSSSNVIHSSNSNRNIVTSPRGPSQSNLSLYSFGKKQSIKNPNGIILQQQASSPLLNSPSSSHSTQQNAYKNTLIRLSKSPKTKKKNNPNIPAILRQFSQKYPNALNEMEASTGSADVTMQEELSVLIADDDVFGISILKMMLKKSGLFTFDVKEVFNGKDSLLEFMKQNHPDSTKPYALVISDIRMPQMDGIESVRKMRQAILNEKYFPATFIGVSAIDQTSQNDTELSIFDIVLSKPLKEQALLNAINQNLLDFY